MLTDSSSKHRVVQFLLQAGVYVVSCAQTGNTPPVSADPPSGGEIVENGSPRASYGGAPRTGTRSSETRGNTNLLPAVFISRSRGHTNLLHAVLVGHEVTQTCCTQCSSVTRLHKPAARSARQSRYKTNLAIAQRVSRCGLAVRRCRLVSRTSVRSASALLSLLFKKLWFTDTVL